MINRVDKKTYSFNVEPTNEEEAIMYLYIQSFHEIVLIKKNHLSKYFSLWWMPELTWVFLKILRFSVKKMDIYKALNSDTSLGDEILHGRQNSNLVEQY